MSIKDCARLFSGNDIDGTWHETEFEDIRACKGNREVEMCN